MKKLTSLTVFLCILCVLTAGCTKHPTHTDPAVSQIIYDGVPTQPNSTSSPAAADNSLATLFPDSDPDTYSTYEDSQSIRIQLNGNTATADSDSVLIAGSTVTLSQEATYIVSGTLHDGMLLVNAADTAKIQIVLQAASITSTSSAALYVRSADKVFVTLAQGTDNTLSNAGTFVAIDENNIDAAVFAKDDLTFNGTGSLTVTSPVAHGIVCKDDLAFTGGSYTVNAASHGCDANDSIRITGTTDMVIDAGKDGIRCENSDDASLGNIYFENGNLHIAAEGDGIAASAALQIDGGSFDLLTGGGSQNGTKERSDGFGGFMGGRPDAYETQQDESGTSMKGMKAVGSLTINNGSFYINSADDAVHSDSSLTLNGGIFEISSGDDAFHAEDTLTVTQCTANISECYEGLEALHLDIRGGNISLLADDDGLNAAGGTDGSGTGGRDGMFGGPGGMWGSSDGSISISGGNLQLTAYGDGIDANGSLTVSGGNIIVTGPDYGDTSTLDYDTTAVITGGTFIGTGAAGMAQTFSDATQGVIATRAGNLSAGEKITVTDSSGNVILTHTPSLPCSVLIFSSPALVAGVTYTITSDSVNGSFTAS